jgi:hypothetical protein
MGQGEGSAEKRHDKLSHRKLLGSKQAVLSE